MNWLRRAGSWVVGSLRWVVGLFSRDRNDERPASELLDSSVNLAPGPYQPEQFQTPLHTEESVLHADELFFVGVPSERPHLNLRQQQALAQEHDLQGGEVLESRRGRGGNFVRLQDGREAFRLNEPVLDAASERSLNRLIAREPDVLASIGARRGSLDLRWPAELIHGFDGGVRGYFTSELEARALANVMDSGSAVRTLAFATKRIRGVSETYGGEDRLELVRILAAWVAAMHAADVVHGSLDLNTIAFSTNPLTVSPLEYATARTLGTRAWAGGANARDTTLDDDRRAFASIAFALLAPQAEGDVSRWLSVPPNLPGIDARMHTRLQWLLARADGAKGTTPTVEEWVRALDERASIEA
jgi:hypothetical protein